MVFAAFATGDRLRGVCFFVSFFIDGVFFVAVFYRLRFPGFGVRDFGLGLKAEVRGIK